MLKLNKVDQEILGILKVVLLTKRVNPMQSDDHMRLWIIRSFFALSVLAILARAISGFFGQEVTDITSAAANMPIAIFFGALFLHINNESENTSLIIFALTWASIVIGLYV